MTDNHPIVKLLHNNYGYILLFNFDYPYQSVYSLGVGREGEGHSLIRLVDITVHVHLVP